MPLQLDAHAQYLTEHVESMRPADFDATHLVKATKGLELNPKSYSVVTVGGRRISISETNKDRAMDWFAEWASEKIQALPSGPKVIIPIPSSKSTPQSAPTFRTALIGQRIAKLCSYTKSISVLRFKAERPNTREEGGSRDPHDLYGEMVLVDKLPPGKIIILDDVVTSGGHLKAAAWLIQDENRAAEYALACGRTTDTQLADPFAVPTEHIDLARSPFD